MPSAGTGFKEIVINDRSEHFYKNALGESKETLRKFCELMVAGMTKPPPQGSPIAGVHVDPRIKNTKGPGGHNRRSIDFKEGSSGARRGAGGRFIKGSGGGGGGPVFEIFTETGYGGWLDIGTSRMPARPYFAPNFEEAKRKID